jgi:ATP-binding cassette subfamily F protein uup
MTLLLNCKDLSKSYGARPLFRGISISLDDTERTGLIGPNGSGKSTLLKILAGLEHSDTGTITSRRQLKLGYLSQHDEFPAGHTARKVLVEAQHEAEHHPADEHELETRADMLLGKVGFADTEQVVDSLSGGWRKRLSIARELIRGPDLLLLDEPTNHLDLEGILWLEKLLANATFSFLLVSHDRYFLENATNRVVELSSAYADGYLSTNGTYSDFLVKREEYLGAQAARQQSLASQVRREIEWLQRGAKARTTKAKGRIQQAGQMMQDLADLKTRNTQSGAAKIDFVASNRQTRKMLAAKKVSKSLGGRPLFSGLDLVLSQGTKLGLLGPNGSGKSTLIKLLAGQEPCDSGEVWRAEQLRIVLFDQSRRQLDNAQTLRDALSPTGETVSYRGASMHVTAWAARFLFRKEQLDLPVSDLSGGEQARVLIAQLMLQPADLLILDEPTNDLDISSLEVLEESLSDFPGALVLVTHDRFMLDRVSTEILALDGKGSANQYASVSQWQDAREAAEEALKQASRASAAKTAAAAAASSPAVKRLSYMEQRELEQMEQTIMSAEEELHAGQNLLEDPAVLADRNRLRDVCTRIDVAQKKVHELYARWEALEARKR